MKPKFCKRCHCFLPTEEEKKIGLCVDHIEKRDEALNLSEEDRREEHKQK